MDETNPTTAATPSTTSPSDDSCDPTTCLGFGVYGKVVVDPADRHRVLKYSRADGLTQAALRELAALEVMRGDDAVPTVGHWALAACDTHCGCSSTVSAARRRRARPHRHFVFSMGRADTDLGRLLRQRLRDRAVTAAAGTAPFGEAEIRVVLASLVRCLARAQARQGVVHRDIKPSNVLVYVGPPLRVQMADWGLSSSSWRAVGDEGRMTNEIQSLWYRSPENLLVLRRTATGDVVDPRAMDVWSLGVLMYDMATTDETFHGSTPLDQLRRVLTRVGLRDSDAAALGIDRAWRTQWPREPSMAVARSQSPGQWRAQTVAVAGLSHDALHFLNLCLTVNPQQRPPLDALARHPFVADVEATCAADAGPLPPLPAVYGTGALPDAVDVRQRAAVVAWLWSLARRRDHTFAQMDVAVTLLDRYLERRPVAGDALHLVASACFLLAAKYVEVRPLSLHDMVWFVKGTFDVVALAAAEEDVLRVVDGALLPARLAAPLFAQTLRRHVRPVVANLIAVDRTRARQRLMMAGATRDEIRLWCFVVLVWTVQTTLFPCQHVQLDAIVPHALDRYQNGWLHGVLQVVASPSTTTADVAALFVARGWWRDLALLPPSSPSSSDSPPSDAWTATWSRFLSGVNGRYLGEQFVRTVGLWLTTQPPSV
jgi:hypothetical protein